MTRAASVAPILVMGWGNVSRGDDAIGPLLVEALRRYAAAQWPGADTIECLDEFQLATHLSYPPLRIITSSRTSVSWKQY